MQQTSESKAFLHVSYFSEEFCLEVERASCDHIATDNNSEASAHTNVATCASVYKMKFLFLHYAAEKHPSAAFFARQRSTFFSVQFLK